MDTSGGDTPQPAVMSTARQLLATTGPAGLTPDAVARASGLPAAAVAGVFPHRDDLLTALLIDAYDTSAAALEEA
ncbi:TetR family transcriptional regulator, partial [Streptomyces sp. SCA2-4]|nr:TetR family transcriptional regulator [Streptomyces huiliensis]